MLLLLLFTEHDLQVGLLNFALLTSSVTTTDPYPAVNLHSARDLHSAVAVFTTQMELVHSLLNLIHSFVHYLFLSHPVVIMGRFI